MEEIAGGWEPIISDPIKTVELQREIFYLAGRITEKALTVREMREHFNRTLIRRLEYEVFTENLDKKLTCDFPVTWWDHFKRDVVNFFIKYVLGYTWEIPYKMRHEELTAKALYPELAASLPEKNPVIRIFKRQSLEVW